MTLTEFLLARIAEDEAFAKVQIRIRDRAVKQGLAPAQEAGAVSLASAVMDMVLEDPEAVELMSRNLELSSSIGTPDRTLAECKAKRQIIERFEGRVRGYAGEEGMFWGGWIDGHLAALEDLAAIYADHRDYREEWRP